MTHRSAPSIHRFPSRLHPNRLHIGRLLGGAALAAFCTALAPGTASAAGADMSGMGQAEWRQSYETAPNMRVQRSTIPILSSETVAATEQAIRQYGEISSKGGWGTVPVGRQMRVGSQGPAVVALRSRLIATGDLGAQAEGSPIFDSFLDAGVRRFQQRHGLTPNGIVGPTTYTELNVPVQSRLRQLQLNLVRLRSFGDLGDRFVTLNIPGAELETVENGRVATHHVAGVGKIDRQSPLLNVKAIDINFNPYWTVPASIIRKDLIPKMQENANYLNEYHIHVYDNANNEVPPNSINWHSMEATKYRFREDKGENNSLGVVRINIPNEYGVYMHDTPLKGVFGDEQRFVSSGCTRVQDVRDYVAWLLKENPGWDRDHIDQVINSGEREDVKLSRPVPVHWVYITGWGAPDGVVQFRPDIYKRDSGGDTMASNKGPRPDEELDTFGR